MTARPNFLAKPIRLAQCPFLDDFEQRTGQTDTSPEVPVFLFSACGSVALSGAAGSRTIPLRPLGLRFRDAVLRAYDVATRPRPLRFCATPCPEFTMNNR
jgi:hypothetical protein